MWVGWWSPIREQTRAIAEAKVKTDKVAAAVLAQLLQAGFLPSVWLPDQATFALRRQVARRAHLRLPARPGCRNQVQSILHRNLVPGCPAADLFGRKGQAWLAEQDLPPDEQQAVGALLRQLDFHAAQAAHRGRRARPGRAGAPAGAPAADDSGRGRHRGVGDRGRGR
jgi:transposase